MNKFHSWRYAAPLERKKYNAVGMVVQICIRCDLVHIRFPNNVPRKHWWVIDGKRRENAGRVPVECTGSFLRKGCLDFQI